MHVYIYIYKYFQYNDEVREDTEAHDQKLPLKPICLILKAYAKHFTSFGIANVHLD